MDNSSTNFDNDHMHISVPTNSLDAKNLVRTSASKLSLPRELILDVSLMIGASDPPPVDDTVVAPVAPLAMASTIVPSIVDLTPATHPYGTRLKHNIKKSKVHTDGTVTYSVVRSSAS